MDSNKFFYLSNDVTFKYLFKNDLTRPFFNELISNYTQLDISKFHLMDNELSSGNSYVSYKTDILLTNDNQSIIVNIELNREYADYVELRNRRYLHKIASTSKDKSYKDKRIVMQLNLNCYTSRDKKDIASEKFQLHDIKNDIVINDFIIYNVFIPKEIDLCYNETIKNKLKLFMCDSYDKMRKIVRCDKELKLVVDEIEKLNNDKFFGGLYNVEEERIRIANTERSIGFEKGQAIGLEKGQSIGYNQKANEVAIEMYKENIDIDLISKITKLSVEEINNLVKEQE